MQGKQSTKGPELNISIGKELHMLVIDLNYDCIGITNIYHFSPHTKILV